MNKERGRSEDTEENEIEITPEMISMGLYELDCYDPDEDIAEDALKKILLSVFGNSVTLVKFL